MSGDWIQKFEQLQALPESERALLAANGQQVSLPAGATVFAPGKAADAFLLLLEGTVRVQQVSSGGREIVLYRVTGGEACIMTTACLLSDEVYSAEGITETPVEAVAISKRAFDEAMAGSPGFRRIVFSDYSHRISDLMNVVEEVAFERMDKRLAQRLISLADGTSTIRSTQQDLATELGTAREVVSRQLKELERRGLVRLSRGLIEIRNGEALSALAHRE